MINREELERLHEAATKGDLTTAERHTESEWVECPFCQGQGEVEAADYCNFDGVALGVQFYGIGKEFGAHEALWCYLRNAVPDILALLTERDTLAAENAALTAKVERMMKSLEPFAQLSRRKANFVIRPDDPILLEAVRALEN